MGLFFGRGKNREPEEKASGGVDPELSSLEDSSLFLTGDDTRDQHSIGLLLESIAEVTSTIDLEDLLVNIVDKSIELTQAERGILLLRPSADEDLQVRVARDAQRQDLPEGERFSTHVVNQVAQTHRPVRTMVRSDAEALDLSRSVYDLKLRAVMCTALNVGNEFLGVIYVDSRAATREFSRSDLAFFDALSRQIAIALTNARLVLDSLEKTRMQEALKIAGTIQAGLLPKKAPEVEGIDLHGWYMPAEETAGDYYDFLQLPDGRVVLVIGDVSGHGVGSALISATARASLRAYLQVIPDLSSIVTRLNRDLEEDLDDNMFMTLFIATVEPRTGVLHYVNAGHSPPLLLSENGEARELRGTGMALGILEMETYAAAEPIELSRGDLLFAFTDGIPEARDADGELLGEARLQEVLRKSRELSSREIIERVAELVGQHEPDAAGDDRTAVALKYLGPGRERAEG